MVKHLAVGGNHLLSFLAKGKIQDSITLGLLAGLIGTVFMDISNFIIYKAGKTETLYGHIAGGLLMAPWRTKQTKNFILGQLTHFTIGSLWGLPLLYILKKTGKDNPYLKGFVISILSFGSLIFSVKVGFLKKFRFTKTFYSALWNHSLYGIVATGCILLLGDPKSLGTCKDRSAQAAADQSFA